MATDARPYTVRWRALDGPGWEHLEVAETPSGVVARGVVIGGGARARYGALYEVELEADWTFRSVAIRRTDGAGLTLQAHGGDWIGRDGRRLPALSGCVDIDLSGSPFTNSLPVRRLAWETGVPRRLRMAWIPLDTLEPVVDEQAYTRLDQRRYRYQSRDGSFERTIEFDERGYVRHYPGLFEVMPGSE